MTHSEQDVRSAIIDARNMNLGAQESWNIVHNRLGLSFDEVLEYIDANPALFKGCAPASWSG